MKKLIFILIIIANLSIGFGYFENKFFCQIQNNKIIVSMKNQSGDYCLNYFKSIKGNLQNIDSRLSDVGEFLNEGMDKDYWVKTKSDLEKKKSENENFLKTLQFSVQDFESKLFTKIKKYLNYALHKEKLGLENKIQTAADNLEQKEYAADIVGFGTERQQKDEYIFKLKLIDNILDSQNFDELMPILIKYFYSSQK